MKASPHRRELRLPAVACVTALATGCLRPPYHVPNAASPEGFKEAAPALYDKMPAGTWQRTGDKAVFTPRVGFAPQTRVTVTIPAIGAAGTKVRTTRATARTVTSTTRMRFSFRVMLWLDAAQRQSVICRSRP